MSDPFELPDDPTTTAYWSAALAGRLILQRCNACGHMQHYPRPLCLDCGALDLDWRESEGVGTAYSVTAVAMKVTDLDPPYVVALVDLDEGPRVLCIALEESLKIGSRVRAAWRQRPHELPRLYVGAE